MNEVYIFEKTYSKSLTYISLCKFELITSVYENIIR